VLRNTTATLPVPSTQRDPPHNNVNDSTDVKAFYAKFAAVDESNHPARRPPLPSRPPLPGPERDGMKREPSQPGSSSTRTSKASVASSLCVSEPSTAPTSIFPEPAMPPNARQELLRSYDWLGFSGDAHLHAPHFCGGEKATPASERRERYHHFDLANGERGRISAKAKMICRHGKTVIFPRNCTGGCD